MSNRAPNRVLSKKRDILFLFFNVFLGKSKRKILSPIYIHLYFKNSTKGNLLKALDPVANQSVIMVQFIELNQIDKLFKGEIQVY